MYGVIMSRVQALHWSLFILFIGGFEGAPAGPYCGDADAIPSNISGQAFINFTTNNGFQMPYCAIWLNGNNSHYCDQGTAEINRVLDVDPGLDCMSFEGHDLFVSNTSGCTQTVRSILQATNLMDHHDDTIICAEGIEGLDEHNNIVLVQEDLCPIVSNYLTTISTTAPCDTRETYQIAPRTASSDRVCGPITVCNASEYQMIAPTATSNRMCAPTTQCSSLQYISVLGTLTSDAKCAPVTNVSTCKLQNSYVSVQPTPTSDRICSPCTTCIGETVQKCCATRISAYCSNTVCHDPVATFGSGATDGLSTWETAIVALAVLIGFISLLYCVSVFRRQYVHVGSVTAGTWLTSNAYHLIGQVHETDKAQQEEFSLTKNLLGDIEEKDNLASMRMKLDWQIPEHHIKWGDQLAKGAYGTVFRCQLAGHVAAVKVLNFSLKDELQRQDFDRECGTLMTVKHPNLLLFYGMGVSEVGKPFLITEFMSRGSLRGVLADRSIKLDASIRSKIVFQVAAGLAHLHDLKIVHRDVKSENCLLDDNLDAKVGDFGTSKLMKQDTSILTMHDLTSGLESGAPSPTETMTRGVGTLLWMAPELFTGQNRYGPEVDIYSFAIIIWELLTRRLPWDEITAKSHLKFSSELYKALTTDRRPALESHESARAHPQCLQLMNRCWRTDPTDRPKFREIMLILKSESMFLN